MVQAYTNCYQKTEYISHNKMTTSTSYSKFAKSLGEIQNKISIISAYCKLFEAIHTSMMGITDVPANREFRKVNNGHLERLHELIISNIQSMNSYLPIELLVCNEVIDLCSDDEEEEQQQNVVAEFVKVSRECPICYEKFSTEQLVFVPCAHFYCYDCFQKLRRRHLDNECPMCRQFTPTAIRYRQMGCNLTYDLIKSSPYSFGIEFENNNSTTTTTLDEDTSSMQGEVSETDENTTRRTTTTTTAAFTTTFMAAALSTNQIIQLTTTNQSPPPPPIEQRTQQQQPQRRRRHHRRHRINILRRP